MFRSSFLLSIDSVHSFRIVTQYPETRSRQRNVQLNMDAIEKRVSDNERVRNWWAAVAARSDPVALPGDRRVCATLTPRSPHPSPLNNLPESDTFAKVVQPVADSIPIHSTCDPQVKNHTPHPTLQKMRSTACFFWRTQSALCSNQSK